jgi:secondary thiamine-phosphate synthase enzyme
MEIYREELHLSTGSRVEIVDITRQVDENLKKSGLKHGMLNIYSKHSTSAVVINENESGLLEDFKNTLEKIIPADDGYRHDRIDNNADSHIRSFLLGGSENIPFQDGRLMLGTWQSIFFVELDGPRQRRLTVTVTGI